MSSQAMIQSDAETRDLIRQTAEGNQRAFEKLCLKYEKQLFRVALDILGDLEIANDVLQEVRLAIWNGSENFRGECKPFSWMWAIVQHKSMDALRSSLRAAGCAERASNYCDVFSEKPELDAVISEALKKLSPEHRLVVILTYYFNFSQYHISRIVHCPVGTVKSRLSNALRELRELWNAPFKLERLSR
jgi:RNA polymerase sigma factor (sigma-70 family)